MFWQHIRYPQKSTASIQSSHPSPRLSTFSQLYKLLHIHKCLQLRQLLKRQKPLQLGKPPRLHKYSVHSHLVPRLRFRTPSRFGTLLLLSLLLSACGTDNVATHTAPSIKPSAYSVASAHPLATQAGLDILAKGGNAFDAAVAVAASLGVVEPYSAGLGGGGFWLLYQAERNRYAFVDARETAPSAAGNDYYLDSEGNVDRDRAINGPTAAGIPGQAAAFVHLAEHYGTLPLGVTLEAAIQQAKNGFSVTEIYRKWLAYRLGVIQQFPASARLFLDDNEMPNVGHVIQQPGLAQTLESIAEKGMAGFYSGSVAKELVSSVQAAGGDWSEQDLLNYSIKERDPIMVRVGEYDVISAPPPSSGGIALAQMLAMLDQLEQQFGPSKTEVEEYHRLAEVMRRAYKDRAEFLGDPDFVEVPTNQLLSDKHLNNWVETIDLTAATKSVLLRGMKGSEEGFHTTHFSIIDTEGNRVSATLSINLPFGSGFVAGNTGVLLNNEMDDFSAKPGEPNAYGLVGNQANAIAPGKRPLSSMTPSMLISDDSVAIIGTPGGSRIITMVLQGLLEFMDDQPVEKWVQRPRIHHQYLPDEIQFEPDALSLSEQNKLESMGHKTRPVGRTFGNMQAIHWDLKSNTVTAASDPRGEGEATVVVLNQ